MGLRRLKFAGTAKSYRMAGWVETLGKVLGGEARGSGTGVPAGGNSLTGLPKIICPRLNK